MWHKLSTHYILAESGYSSFIQQILSEQLQYACQHSRNWKRAKSKKDKNLFLLERPPVISCNVPHRPVLSLELPRASGSISSTEQRPLGFCREPSRTSLSTHLSPAYTKSLSSMKEYARMWEQEPEQGWVGRRQVSRQLHRKRNQENRTDSRPRSRQAGPT